MADMSVSLRDILELEVFRSADAVVVCGRRSLGRTVRWVHLGETMNIAPFLTSGDLYLTSGELLTTDPPSQRRFVRELLSVPISGLVIEIGRCLKEVPPAIVSEASAGSLPVIALRRATRFIDVTEQVSSAIIEDHYRPLRIAEEAGEVFNRLLLQGSGVHSVLQELVELVGNPVVLDDAARQVVDYAPPGRLVSQLIADWESHARSGHAGDIGGTERGPSPFGSCIWMPVTIRGEAWGRIHIVSAEHRLSQAECSALRPAAVAVGLAVLQERTRLRTDVSERARAAVIAGIFDERIKSLGDVYSQAPRLGKDLRNRQLFTLAVAQMPAAREDHNESDIEPEFEIHSLLNALRDALRHEGCAEVSGLHGQCAVAAVGAPAGRQVSEVVEAVWRRARSAATRLGIADLAGGASDRVNPESLRVALIEAEEAAHAVMATGASGLKFFSELRLHAMLREFANGLDGARFVEAELGPILSFQARRRTPLIATLRSFLEHNGNRSACAEELHIQRKSLYYRLDVIMKLLRVDIDSAEARVRLYVAIRLLDILHMRGKGT
jgi:purine catabolism regulator